MEGLGRKKERERERERKLTNKGVVKTIFICGGRKSVTLLEG
jgi:hypothetical protein